MGRLYFVIFTDRNAIVVKMKIASFYLVSLLKGAS